MRYAAGLICELAGGRLVGPVTDYYPTVVAPYKVIMQYRDFGRLIGADFHHDTIDTILDALEIERKGDGENLVLGVPTYRVDVRRPCDVIEDFLRIYDYNKIPMDSRLHASLSYKTPVDAADDLRRTVSDMLTGAGWSEILNNSLTAEAYYAEPSELAAKCCVKLLNPLSIDLNVMRQTLLFGGLETIAHNTAAVPTVLSTNSAMSISLTRRKPRPRKRLWHRIPSAAAWAFGSPATPVAATGWQRARRLHSIISAPLLTAYSCAAVSATPLLL